jgi:antirestriction protein ArdC
MPGTSEQPIPKPRDFRQEVTDNIVALLEKGVAPWQKPWDAQSQLAMPVNPTTDRAYRGGNAIHLLAVGLQRNYEDPRWMTYKQASEHGWQVRKGERGTQIEFWDVKLQQNGSKQPAQNSEPSREGDQTKGDESGSRLVHRVYTVFNARQIDGVPALASKERQPFEVAEAGERILKNSGASIAHDQADRAFYDRRKDEIHLPPQQAFKDAAGYYGTALHELGHWTGHPSRLDRWTLTENYKFGDTRYAKEELRAELASVFIAAEKGIPHDPQNHAAYVGSWIQALKQDKNEIFRAAHDASKAADLLLSL